MYGERVVTTYERVRVRAVKRLPCPVCGKPLRRQWTAQETVSPWNKNSDGTVKTHREVLESVRAKAAAWEVIPETCSSHE